MLNKTYENWTKKSTKCRHDFQNYSCITYHNFYGKLESRFFKLCTDSHSLTRQRRFGSSRQQVHCHSGVVGVRRCTVHCNSSTGAQCTLHTPQQVHTTQHQFHSCKQFYLPEKCPNQIEQIKQIERKTVKVNFILFSQFFNLEFLKLGFSLAELSRAKCPGKLVCKYLIHRE